MKNKHTINWPVVRLNCCQAFLGTQMPYFDLSVKRAAEYSRKSARMLREDVNAVVVAVECAYKRLCEQTLKLCSVERARILDLMAKRIFCIVEIATN